MLTKIIKWSPKRGILVFIHFIISYAHDDYDIDHLFKPIFHQNTNSFALGPHVGLYPQRNDSALPVPICWYLKSHPKICVTSLFCITLPVYAQCELNVLVSR